MSEPKYRAADPRDAGEISRVLRLAFNVTDVRTAQSMDRAGLDEIRVLDLGAGELGAVTYLIPMGIFFGGSSVSNVGVAAVGVPPEHRGRGLSTRIMQAVLREAREREFAVSTLHPATQTVYRKVGFQCFGGYFETRMPLATIEIRDRAAALARYRPEDREAVRALHARWARSFDGHLDRSEYIWQAVHKHRDLPAEGYLVREGGELTGYCFLAQEHHAGLKYDLRATALVATTRGAARRLLTFFADHRSLGHDLITNSGPSDPILMHVPEDRYEVKLRHHVMIRIVDVKRALEQRGYPKLLRARLELEVADPLLTENAGRWVLEVESGRGTVSRGGSGASLLRTDAAGLAALFGQLHPAQRLAGLGWLEGDAEAIDAASAVFAGAQSSLVEMF